MATSDVALARRVLAGDEAAFEEFFDRYFPRLFRFALPRLAGNADATEEIVQSVLIRGLARLHTYRGEAALLTWLCTLCRHEIANWREHEGRLREVSFFDDQPEVRATLEALTVLDPDDPELALRRRELSELVQVTLDHLPGRYGDVLEWKYLQGLSVTEIADRLGVGYKAAESVLARARAAFRQGISFAAGEWTAAGTARIARAEKS
jgi:RNA polymerase sigma-70 factor (ECF subfamily)